MFAPITSSATNFNHYPLTMSHRRPLDSNSCPSCPTPSQWHHTSMRVPIFSISDSVVPSLYHICPDFALSIDVYTTSMLITVTLVNSLRPQSLICSQFLFELVFHNRYSLNFSPLGLASSVPIVAYAVQCTPKITIEKKFLFQIATPGCVTISPYRFVRVQKQNDDIT